MIKVYLRHEVEDTGSLLGEFDVDQIENLIELIKSRECYFDKYNTSANFSFACFVVDKNKQAHFEIMYSYS